MVRMRLLQLTFSLKCIENQLEWAFCLVWNDRALVALFESFRGDLELVVNPRILGNLQVGKLGKKSSDSD